MSRVIPGFPRLESGVLGIHTREQLAAPTPPGATSVADL